MELISTEAGQRPDPLQAGSGSGDIEGQGLGQDTDVGYQEIHYAKGSVLEAIPSDPTELSPIDLPDALGQTMALVPAGVSQSNGLYAHITFYNQKNLSSLHILRVADDLWNLDTPAFCDDPVCICKHVAQCDTKRLEDVIKTFFDGGDWYGLVPFRFDSEVFEIELRLQRDGKL